jgi:flagellar biosynthesis protein FlhA
MDGAARFNQRDSLATILITAINIIAGLLIGTLQQGIELGEAARTYTVLTVGDGLVTLIPSLLVSVAGGITLTRANSAGLLGGEIRQQLLAKPNHALSGQPGLGGHVPDSGTAQAGLSDRGGGALWGAARGAQAGARPAPSRGWARRRRPSRRRAPIWRSAAPGRSDPRDRLPTDSAGGREAGRATAEPGALAAPPSLRGDGLSGAPGAHLGQPAPEAARVPVLAARHGDRPLADRGAATAGRLRRPGRRPLAGKEAREPAFGVPAIWIAPALEDQAIAAGYSVVDAVTVITTHLGELIRRHAWELLGRAETKRLMDALNESHPKLLEELVPKLLTLGEVGRVLEQLLRERVSIRDLGAILEGAAGDRAGEQERGGAGGGRAPGAGAAAGSAAARRRGPVAGSAARPGARRGDSGTRLAPETGQRLLAARAATPGTPVVRRLADSLRQLIGAASAAALPVLLCPSPARYHVKRWLEPVLPRLAVVAAGEIPPEIRLRPVGTVR